MISRMSSLDLIPKTCWTRRFVRKAYLVAMYPRPYCTIIIEEEYSRKFKNGNWKSKCFDVSEWQGPPRKIQHLVLRKCWRSSKLIKSRPKANISPQKILSKFQNQRPVMLKHPEPNDHILTMSVSMRRNQKVRPISVSMVKRKSFCLIRI